MGKHDSTVRKHDSTATKNVPKTGIVDKKRKKRRSHAQIAKKFARQRNITGNLDRQIYQYMIEILDTLRTDFASSSDKLLFVNNVYAETVGQEVECARNQVASRVMDSLLPFAGLEIIQRLVEALEPSLRQLSGDRFASHVLQKIIVVCADRGNRVPAELTVKTEAEDEKESGSENDNRLVVEIKPDEVKIYNDIVLKLSKYFLNNIEEFAFDIYANHVLRTVLQCLAGLIDISDDSSARKKFKFCPTNRRPVIQEYEDLLIQNCQRLQQWPQLCEFGLKDITSGLVQCVLFSLKDVDADLTKNIIKKILLESQDNEKRLTIFNLESSARLLEACLMTSPPKTYCKLYKTFFADNLEHLCQNQNSNYSVQRLLDSCASKDTFEEIFDKVVEHFPQILKRGFTGILVSTGNACLKLHTKQGAFVNAITKMLDCADQAHLVWCTATLKTRSQLEDNPSGAQVPLNLHGSLITQAMLKFNKPIVIVKSLLQMSNEELSRLFDDPKGSRILDAFMDSEYVGEKSREKLCKKLQGVWADLAKSTHGSRCLDKMWEKVSETQKIFIMEELAAAGEALRSTKSSQVIFKKLNVSLFAKNKTEWKLSQSKQQKTKKLFANIIGKK
ncbi:hypothetical protein DMN91_002656 [Ooceraea biroi]|uniref:Pumilio domain-containing protein C14orf21-like protein n=1 Tax=Ooceraea biroi TaxID=2015173 RepID=A0A026WQG8_OOCBI|nr:nucleolar protein 9 [Ooceraea biroi]EZA57354.1 Pumilio domain-containing protein C14orf21-like protein [Ooceraea biroi]RLU24567.1 hypothetical protein DMN91_002656 [Ooceraea biroi]